MSPDILPRVLMPSTPRVGSEQGGEGPSTGHGQLQSKQRQEESHDHSLIPIWVLVF